MHDLQLEKFDPREMEDGCTVLIIAKRNSGKSWLVRDLCYHKKDIPLGIAMSGSEESNRFYGKFIADSFVFPDFRPDKVEAIKERQIQLVKQKKMTSMFLICDDLMYDKGFLNHPIMRYMFLNGRHLKVWLVCTTQYINDVGPAIRGNIDYVFAFREPSRLTREKLWKNFFSIVPTFDMFCQIMDECTRNYECLVYDNTKRTGSIKDHLKYYEAVGRGDFWMGSSSVWKYHDKTYNPEHGAGSDEEDALEKIRYRPLSKPKMHVRKLPGKKRTRRDKKKV